MNVPLIVIGAILLFFLFLLLLPVKVLIVYKSEVTLTLRVLGIPIRLYPRKKKVKWRNYSPKKAARIAARKEKKEAKKAARKAAKKSKKQARQEALPPEQKKGKLATMADKLRLVRVLAGAVIRKTGKHLRLHTARLHISVGASDAAKTAILYGVVCQSVAYLMALLDRVTRLKSSSSEVTVTPDYLSERSKADVKLVFSLRVLGALIILFSAAFAYVKLKFERKNTQHKTKHTAKKAVRTVGTQKGNRHG